MISRSITGTRTAVAFLAILQLTGCALIAPKPPAPAEPMPAEPAVQAARALELTRALAQRERGLDSIETSAVMEYSAPGRHLKAREQLAARRPQSLRVEAMSPFGVAVVVAATDSQLQIFRASDNTLIRGAATAGTLDRFAQIPMAPGPAVALLMGLAPSAELAERPPDSVTTQGDLIVAVYRVPGGGTIELGFAGKDLAMVRKRTDDGQVGYEVRYSDFRDIGGLMMAYRIDAEFPSEQTSVKFRYQRPIVNGAIADSAFVLTPGPATRQIDLDHAALSPTALSN